jgi:Fungal specific transcription factor domain
MDGGERAAEYAQKIKGMVKTTTQRRRKDQSRRVQPSPSPSPRLPATVTYVSGSSPSTVDGSLVASADSPSTFDSTGYACADPLAGMQDPEVMYLGTPASITEPTLPHSVQVESDLHRRAAVGNGRMPHPRICSTSSVPPIDHLSVPQSQDFIFIQTDKEAILLSFYFDCIFDFQFPFYKRPSSTSGRGWLLSLLAEKGPPYFASIALSATFQQVTRPEEAIAGYSRDAAFQDAQGYQNIAIRGLRDQLDSYMMAQEAGGCDPRTCVRLLFSILQLIFASVRYCSGVTTSMLTI